MKRISSLCVNPVTQDSMPSAVTDGIKKETTYFRQSLVWRSGQGLNLLGTCNVIVIPSVLDHSVRAAYHQKTVHHRDNLLKTQKFYDYNECLNQC